MHPYVLFDMDGTLLDTRHDIARAANNARHELGLPPMSIQDVVRAVGDGVNLFVSRVTFPQDHARFAEAREIFMRHYAENVIGETMPYAGIEGLLALLHKNNVLMAVVSNKPEALVIKLVEHFRWQHYFECALGGDSAAKPKPSADPILLALQLAKLAPTHPVVMVGDGPQDVLAAKSVGATAIWCDWGFNPTPPSDYPVVRVKSAHEIAAKLKIQWR